MTTHRVTSPRITFDIPTPLDKHIWHLFEVVVTITDLLKYLRFDVHIQPHLSMTLVVHQP